MIAGMFNLRSALPATALLALVCSCTGVAYLPGGDAASSPPDAQSTVVDGAVVETDGHIPDPPDASTPDAEAPDAAIVCTNSSPDFTLEDVNTISPTYQQNRTLSDTCGRVVILYFALFS